MSHLTLNVLVNTDGDDFATQRRDDGAGELMARQLETIAQQLRDGRTGYRLRDANGQWAGRYDLTGVNDDDKLTDQHKLGDALLIVKRRNVHARKLHLETSDQNHYGFVLTGITLDDGRRVAPEDAISDDATWDRRRRGLGSPLNEIADLLADLNWNGYVGEDEHGYATWEIPT